MKRVFNEEFKEQALVKALNRGAEETLEKVAKSLGIGYSTLQRWIRASGTRGTSLSTQPKRPQDWTAQQKLDAIIQSHTLEGEALSGYCREQGIFAHHIKLWEQEWIQTQDKSKQRVELRHVKTENKQLKRELQRKDKALAEVTALLVLKKKVECLWDQGEVST